MGVWAGLLLTIAMLPSSADKLSRPFSAARLIVAKKAVPLGPWAQTMIVDQRLKLTGAWEITSGVRGFGGLSAVLLARGELLFLNDGGALVRLHGAPDAAISRGIIAPLPGACGESWRPGDRDTESMALTPDRRGLRVGVEGSNSLCVLDYARPTAGTRFSPPPMRDWRLNSGAESMAMLAGRAMVIIAEGTTDKRGVRVMLWYAGDPADPATPLIKMLYRPPPGYSPTDAAFLPDGRLLVVNRAIASPVSFPGKLMLVPAFAPAKGMIVTGSLLAQIDDPAISDNYEGIAVAPTQGGATIWLVSDNNFSAMQRNMLLRFTFSEKPNRAKP